MATDIFCPACRPILRTNGEQIGRHMELVEDNYSGTREDIYQCEACKRIFAVSYKVDEITHLTDWGGNDTPVPESKPV